MIRGEKRKGKKCFLVTCQTAVTSPAPQVNRTWKGNTSFVIVRLEKVAKSCTVVQTESECWWEMTSSTGLWLWSLQIRVSYSPYWLVRLHPYSLNHPTLSFHNPLDENASLFLSRFSSYLSFFYLLSCITAIKHTPRTLMTAERERCAVISLLSQSAMQSSGIFAGWKTTTQEVASYKTLHPL